MFSIMFSPSLLTEPPGEPTDVSVVSRTPTSVTMKWEPPLDLGGRTDLFYRLWYQPENGVRIIGLETNSTSGTVTGVTMNSEIQINLYKYISYLNIMLS